MVNTHRPVLERFVAAFGGVIGLHYAGDERSRPRWVWRAYGDTAASALTSLIPLLHEKAPQAFLGLQYRSLKSPQDRAHITAALSMLKRTSHYR